jgi:hypothetical protein
VETFKELADQAAKKPNDPFCAYARQWREAIRDNISKVEWRDSFARDQLKGGWEDAKLEGLSAVLDKQRLRLGGTQKIEGKACSVERSFDGGRVLRYEVAIDAPPGTKAALGLSLTKSSANQVDGLYFGRDPLGRLAWRSTKQGKPGDWNPIDAQTWPATGKAVLAIERVESDSGGWRLLLDGKPVLPLVPGEALAARLSGPWRLGVFGEANLGADWQFHADDVRVLMTKKT